MSDPVDLTDARAATSDAPVFMIGFTGNVLLQAATGRPFTTRVAEVWNLPSTIVYPVLAVNLESQPDPIKGAPAPNAFTKYSLKCWYVTDGPMLEAMQLRDALRGLLHLQMAALAANGVFVEWIECTDSRVMILADINKHQAFVQFTVIA